MVSLRTASEPLLQLSFGCCDYVQYFWRSQEYPCSECLSVPHRQGGVRPEGSPAVLSFSAGTGGPAAARELSLVPELADRTEPGGHCSRDPLLRGNTASLMF